MKIWQDSVSEHSMRLVMIGKFKTVQDANKAREIIEKFTTYSIENEDILSSDTDRFDKSMIDLMESVGIYHLGPSELEQFIFDVSVDVKESNLIIHTDEIEVSAFIKILIDKGAKVEVYSAHDYPDVSEVENVE